MIRRVVIASSILLACCASPPTHDAQCASQGANARWTTEASAAWTFTRDSILQAAEPSPPVIVLYDDSCAFTRDADGEWRSAPHNGAVPLPDGGELPPQVASFAAPSESGGAFFVMALPTIWETEGVQSDLGLDALTKSVMIHELTHTLQFAGFGPRLDALIARYSLGDDLNDDIVQETFRENADYVAAYEAERDLLFQAAAAVDIGEARRLAGQALTMMQARRARFFVGENAKLADLEDVFLSMEGAAQWAGYAWLTDAEGGGVAPQRALPGMRRGGLQWSQDEGLAIYLVLDRLVPDWRARSFSNAPETALTALQRIAA